MRESRRALKNGGKIALVYHSGKANFKDGVTGFKDLLKRSRSLLERFKHVAVLTLIGILNLPMKYSLNCFIYSSEYVEGLLRRHGFVGVTSKSTYFSRVATLTSGFVLK